MIWFWDRSESGWGSTINCSLSKYTFPCWAVSWRLDDPTKSGEILITWGGEEGEKKNICSVQRKKEGNNCYVAKTWTSAKPSLIPTILGKLKKKKATKPPQLFTFPLHLSYVPVSHRTAVLHKLQMTFAQQTAGYRIPGKRCAGLR